MNLIIIAETLFPLRDQYFNRKTTEKMNTSKGTASWTLQPQTLKPQLLSQIRKSRHSMKTYDLLHGLLIS